MVKVTEYWDKMEAKRAINGRLPADAFDFVSVHGRDRFKGKYWLVSPMMLVEARSGKRPRWEQIAFDTLHHAVTFAGLIARKYGLKIVDCREPKTLGGDSWK